MDNLNYLEYIQVPAGIREDLKPLLDALARVEPPQVEIRSADRERLYFSHRRQEGADWYWAVNDTERDRRVVVRFPGTGRFEKWDAETGERWALPATDAGGKSELELLFGPHDAFFVVRHEGRERAEPFDAGGEEDIVLTLPATGWRFTPEAARLEVPYATVEGETEPLWLAPERLSQREWWLIGPFPYGDHEGFFREFPPSASSSRTPNTPVPTARWAGNGAPRPTISCGHARRWGRGGARRRASIMPLPMSGLPRSAGRSSRWLSPTA